MARKVLKAKNNQGTKTVIITDKEGNVKKEKSTYKSDGYKEKTKLKVKTKKDATSAPTATLTTIIKSKGSPKEKIVTKGDYDPVEQYVKPRKDLERNAAAMMKVKNPPNYSILNPEYKASTKSDEEIKATRLEKRYRRHNDKAKETLDSNENKSYRHHEKAKKLKHKRRLKHGLTTLEVDLRDSLGRGIGRARDIGGLE